VFHLIGKATTEPAAEEEFQGKEILNKSIIPKVGA
jgi:hypothetical protein